MNAPESTERKHDMFRFNTRPSAPSSDRPALHRRFIGMILAASVAITGFTAAPARADDDLGKFLAGLAAIAIIGAAIESSRDDDVRVIRKNTVRVTPGHNHHHNKHKHNNVRPLPQNVKKFDLPAHCLRKFPGLGNKRVLGRNCLAKSYRHVNALPQACKIAVDRGQKHRVGYEMLCLRERGYRLTSR
jgi:hypothetical protein